MSIKATGQITLVDLTDGQLSVYLASNLPKTQIYNSKDESFSPDWRETNLQIVPNISLNQRTINLNDVTITYKKQVGTGAEQNLDGITEVVNNKILTVNTNVLDYNNAKTVTYFAYINYNNLFSARADITFSLLNEGVDGDEGSAGADGYTFILSNESYIFKGGVGAAQTDQVVTTLTAYKGAIEQNVKIKSVNGVTASTTSYSTGITGLTFKVSSTASVKHPSITFDSTAQLTQSNGNLAIQFECDGKTWTKFFSYGVALTGADAINYWMIVSSAAINRDDNSGSAVFSPNQFTLEAKNNVGATGVSNYYARFIIEGTTNNSTWTTLYTSSQNEISKTYTITNNTYIAYRCSMYLAGGTTTLLDRQLIPVVFDGMDVKGLSLTSSSYIVSYDNKGDLKDNTNITLTANQQNFTDTITWTTSPNVTLSGSGLTRTLNPSVFNNIDKITVTISAGTFTDSVTITKIVDGANAYSVGVRSINFDAVDKASAFFINGNLIETLPISVDTRGYILYTLNIDDLSILSRSHYDTWLYPDTATDLANAINAITDPCIIVLVQVDASTVNNALRSAIASIGGKQTGTWHQERRSHYVVGMPGLTIGQGYEDWGSPSENVTKMTVVPVTIGSGIVLNGTNTFTHIKYSDDGGQTFSYPDSIVSKDFNDWIIGHWRAADGVYEENAYRICCPNLVPIEQGIDYYFNTYNSNYKFVIRLYDENKEFLSSIGAKNNGSIMLTNTASYFGVSIYNSTQESSASSSEYMRLFETGELIPVICKYTESGRGDSAAAYIGVYYDNVDEDSTNPMDYTWTKLTGDENENVDPEEPKSSVSIILSNEAQSVYADENGNVSADEIAKVQSDVAVYVGTEEGITGTVGQNKWIKTIWDNAKTTSGMDANDGRRPIIPANTKFTADKILLLNALEKIKEVEKNDYTYYGQDGMSIYEEQMPWYVGKMSTYIYCSRDYNVDCPMYHDDTTTLKINGKIIYYKGHYVHEDTVPISFSKGLNKLEFYWTQVTTPNGVGFRTQSQLHNWEVVQRMNAYGYKYYTLSIKSQTPNIGATINNTGTGFTATSIPNNVDSGTVVLTVTMFDGTEIDKTFTWTKAKKGQTGNAGADGLTVLLTDENHSFAADTDHATAAETSTNIIAYKGNTQIATQITKIGNVSASTSYNNTNITGLQAKVTNNNTTSTSINFKASTSLVTASGMIPIEMTVDGRTFIRYYSFSLALKGQKGETGATGSAGKGISSTEITYKASSSGVTPPSGNDWLESVVEVAEGQFLWTKTYTTYTDGTHTTAYSVGRMGENGTDGDDGIGITLTTIRYIESDQNQTPPDASANWQQSIPNVTPGNYLWTKTVFAYSDNTTKTIYSIARQGLNGTNGTNGINGTSSYIHIKYSAVANPTDAQIGEEPNTYIGICVDNNQTDPTTASSYEWSKLEGTDGNDGAPGRNGIDGTSAYVHFAYSTSADGQENFSTTSFSGALYIGVRTDSTQQDSQVYSDYAWSLIKGEKGDTGAAAKLVDINATSQVFKCPTDSTTYSPTTIVLTPTFQGGISYNKWQYSTNGGSSWTDVSSGSHGLTISSGKLTIQNSSDLYNSTTSVIFKCISNDNNYTDTITILKIKDGNTGSAGRGVSSTTVTYQVSNSGTTVPSGTWESSVQQTTTTNPYLWTKTEITYTSGNPSTSYSVSKMGIDGNTGPQGTSVTITSKEVKYQSGMSGTTAPTGTWTSTIPSVSQGDYLWTRTVVNYSTGDSTTSYSVSYQGNDGNDGKGISTTSVTYQIGNSASTAPGGTWSSTVKTPTDEKPYLWTKTLITYTDSTETTSYSVSKKGIDGQTGPQGPQGTSVTITTKEISYVANSDGSTPPSSGWSTNFPTVNIGQYLWTKTYILYSTGEESTSYSVGYKGTNGTSPYNVILSNESQTIAANESGNAVATTLTTNVIAYEGITQIATNIGTISGLPSGITAQINNNNTTNTSITFTVTTSLQTQTGQITIPVTVATGVTINKHFSYSLSKTGTAAKLVNVTANDLVFKCPANSSTYTPNSIVLTPQFQGGISYNKWEVSIDGGSTYTTAPGDYTGITIASSNPRTLTVTNSSSVFNTTSSVSFRCVSNNSDYTDTITVLKIKDGDKGDKGDTGDAGNGISSTEIAYAISSSGASAPTDTSDWGNFQEPTTAKPYLWTRTITHYTQSSDKTVYTVSKKGADGTPGRSILAVQEFYKKTSTASVPTIDNTWITPPTAIPVVDETNKYLWNYEKITYSSGTLEENKGPRMIGMYSKDGNTGKGISSITNKYLATNLNSGVTKNTTGWSTDPSTQIMDSTKQFLWNYEIITYTDSTTSETDPCIIGKFGVNGTSVTITSQSVAYYNIGKTDNNTPPAEDNSGWKSSMAAINPTKGDFIWIRTIVNYSDSTKTVSYSKSYEGSDGTSPYNIILSNEAQTVAAAASGYVAQETNVTTNIIAYQGATQVATTVGTITTGVTGLEAQINNNGGTSTSITFKFKTTMNTQTGQVAIPITVGSTTITKYFSYSLSRVGATGDKGDTGNTGPKGDDALLVDIVPSAQLFKSTDGGTTFSPSEITLTPRLQNVSFSNWQYSIDGGTNWTTITNTTSSQTDCYYGNDNVLHIPVGYTQYTNNITAITFKCNASGAASISDTMTIAKLYDVTELDIGGRNLFKYTAYKRITSSSVPTANANGASTSNPSYVSFSSINTSTYKKNGNNSLTVQVSQLDNNITTGYAMQSLWNNLITDRNVLFSCYIYSTQVATFRCKISSGEIKTYPLAANTWTKVEIDYGTTAAVSVFRYTFNTTGTYYINSMKLEYGNRPTDWTPAPEDVDNKIDEETDPEKVVAEINATGNTVQISGAHINFNGVAMFNSLSASNDTTPHTIINGGEIVASTLQSTNYTLNNIATDASALSVGTDLSDVTLSFREIITYADAPFDGWSDGNYIIFETDNYYMKYTQSSDNNSFSQNLSIYTSQNVLLTTIYSVSTGEQSIEKEIYTMPSDSGEVTYINNIHNICDSIGVARKINIGDDLSEATINLDYTWASVDTFEYLFPRSSNGSFVIFKTSGGYTLQYERGVNPATAEINPNMSWDEISLYDKNHTLITQLYGADSKWGKSPYPTISTYILPIDCGRVVYSDPAFDSNDRVSAEMIYYVATAGMKIDLNNGTIDSKNFVVNSKGDILIAGQLRSMQDNLLFGSETFDIFDDYGGLLMELNSYGMAFYGGSENNYIGSIGEMTQMMNIAIPLTPEQIEEDWPQEYQLEECPGLCIAAKPQTKDGLTPNYFVALGLANSDNEISPLIQVSGYPYLDQATELYWTIDLGPTGYETDTNYCEGLRIRSGEVCSYGLNRDRLMLEEDPELTEWNLSLSCRSLRMGGWGNTTIGVYPTLLYQNTSGAMGTITLNQSAANFDFIEIYVLSTSDSGTGYAQNCTRVWSPNGKTAWLTTGYCSSGAYNLKLCSALISGNQITRPYGHWEFNANEQSTTNYIGITRVIGYK